MNQQPFPTKKIIRFAALAIVLLIAGRIAYYFLTTGTVTATATGAQTMTITSLTNGTTKKANGTTIKARLKAGDYSVKAQYGDNVTQQTIKIPALHGVTTQLRLQQIGSIEPVSPRSVIGFRADNQGLMYYDVNNDNLYRVGVDNVERVVDLPESLNEISWASGSYGIASSTDGTLYTINDDVLNPITLPFSDSSSFAASAGQQYYVTEKNTLYRGGADGLLRKVSTGNTTRVVIAAAAPNGNLLLRDITDVEENSDDGESKSVINMFTLTKSGLSSRHQYTVGHGSDVKGSWSADGQRVVLSTPLETLLTDASLNTIDRLPDNDVVSPVWINNDTVAYGKGSTVWVYSITTKTAYALGDSYNDQPIRGLYSGNDGDHVYVSLQSNAAGEQLGRISLKQPDKNSRLLSLGIILPVNLDECSVGYTNFIQPTINVFGPATSRDECLQKTTDYLQGYRNVLNTSQIPVVYNPDS